MKISYILQLKEFLIMFILGILMGIIYGILNTTTSVKKNIAIQIIADIIFCIITFLTFIISINIINWGEFRVFLLVGMIIGFGLERITLGKLFAKLFKKLYNYIVKLGKAFVKSKLGRIIFK